MLVIEPKPAEAHRSRQSPYPAASNTSIAPSRSCEPTTSRPGETKDIPACDPPASSMNNAAEIPAFWRYPEAI